MIQKHALYILFISFCLSFYACKNTNNKAQFYYWKQNVNIDKELNLLIDTVNTTKLYVKFFDIKYLDKQSYPISKVNFNFTPKNIEIVPCIYITNKSMLQEQNVQDLAFKTNKLIQEICRNNNFSIKTIQIDCDWTLNSKTNYFEFLKALKGLQNDIKISSTLRLHQLKYASTTGIPPVDKVTLMCYNLGDIQDENEENSILKLEDVKSYISANTTYPLPMDFALPVFSWAAVYRFNHLALIVNNISKQQLEKNSLFEKQKDGTFKVLKNNYFNNTYFYKDDILRYEDVTAKELQEIVPLFKPLKDKNSELLFFDLSNTNALNYTHEDYQTIISKF